MANTGIIKISLHALTFQNLYYASRQAAEPKFAKLSGRLVNTARRFLG
jgi:hypothetical protein